MDVILDLDDATMQHLKRRADEQGLPDAAAYAKWLVESDREPMTRGQRAVERMSQFKTIMTADELMEMTRSEV